MKLSTLLLVGSLAANAALLGLFAVRPALAPPAFRDFFVSDTQRAADVAAEKKAAQARSASLAKAAAAKRAGVWSSLQTDDLKSLIARLRAAGFSPVVIRAIVSARLESTFSARMNELVGSIDVPFWKPDAINSYNNPKFYETQSQIYRDRAKALREILGDDYFAGSAGDATAAQRQKYGDLPKSKIDLIDRIADDYAEMISQVKAATNGIMLPEDREKLALLEREKRADLAAILSPAELEDYEMRNSTITMRLRGALTLLDASLEEYRAIYRIQQPFAEILYPTSTGGMTVMTADLSRQRTEAQKQIADQLKVALGEQRYADFARASNYEYQNLYRIAQRENVTLDAINRTYDLRASAAQESQRIQDAKLSPEARTAALQTLVADTKAKITGNLGSNLAENYTKNLSWLNALERGYTLRLTPDGSGISFMMGPSTARPTTNSTTTTTIITTVPPTK